MVGDTVGRVYGTVRSMRDTENLRAMLERGEDPYTAMVDRGRELGIDVWNSIRMNDNHFWDIDSLEAMQTSKSQGLTDMRRQHPEWCLGDDAPNWCTTSWNMAIPEVREHKLDLIEQACRLADWDGVELDWQRHAFHLPGKHEYRLRYALTDLQRAIRRMTDAIAEERGRPFPVAVRVGATLEACRNIGYDIETWANEGLCDIIIGGGNSGTDPCFETEEFLSLVEGTNILVYPGYDFESRQAANRLIPHSEWRNWWFAAMSQGHFERGAHGIYAFNWHAGATTRRESLTSIGSPETLRRKNKAYTAIQRSIANNPLREDAERDDRLYGEVPVTLYRTLTHDGPTVNIPVYDDVETEAASVQLLIELEHFSPTGGRGGGHAGRSGLGSADRPKRQCRGPDHSRVGGREQLARLGPQSCAVRQGAARNQDRSRKARPAHRRPNRREQRRVLGHVRVAGLANTCYVCVERLEARPNVNAG